MPKNTMHTALLLAAMALSLPALAEAPASAAAACPPAQNIGFYGLRLGATLADIQKTIPQARRNGNGNGSAIVIPADVAIDKAMPGVARIGYIQLDQDGKVIGFALGFDGQGQLPGGISYSHSTPLAEMVASFSRQHGLPATAWKIQPLMSQEEMQSLGYDPASAEAELACAGYRITLSQDFASGRQALGPSLMVQAETQANQEREPS
ncbi:hypothetical protein AAHN93_10100 [Vandammella animalimorsus]|uniref:hypothetical protein n=1 Tax=Vandammella animalimorsus TaxID=2029117 RepID=UPI0031B9ACFC